MGTGPAWADARVVDSTGAVVYDKATVVARTTVVHVKPRDATAASAYPLASVVRAGPNTAILTLTDGTTWTVTRSGGCACRGRR
jgi:hypothetical protein